MTIGPLIMFDVEHGFGHISERGSETVEDSVRPEEIKSSLARPTNLQSFNPSDLLTQGRRGFTDT